MIFFNSFKILFLILTFSFFEIISKINVRMLVTEKPDLLIDNQVGLAKRGIVFVNKDPDIILCNEVTEEILKTEIPIIILEKRSASYPRSRSIEGLKHFQVKALFKSCIFHDKNKYLEKVSNTVGHHFTILANILKGSASNCKFLNLDKDLLKKIYCVPWNYNSIFSKRFNILKKYNINLSEHRPIDVFFAGSLRLDGSPEELNFSYGWGRKKTLDIISSMKDVKSEIYVGRPLDYEKYIEKLKQSKIVVSPWGMGEWCFRDIEAMYSGALVVKPNTSYLKTFPNIFLNNVTYVPFREDFSNLEYVIRKVLNNYDDFHKIIYRAKSILKLYDIDSILDLFSKRVKKIYKESYDIKFNEK